jgi:hypothetical protein
MSPEAGHLDLPAERTASPTPNLLAAVGAVSRTQRRDSGDLQQVFILLADLDRILRSGSQFLTAD